MECNISVEKAGKTGPETFFKKKLTAVRQFEMFYSHTETTNKNMRTKTLLLAAALSAAGAATSMAQPVYSQNIVGYINLTIKQGYNLIANQLNASPNNTVTNLLASAPNDTFVSKFNPATGGYVTIDKADGAWEAGDPADLNMKADPGEGIFVKTPLPAGFTVTLVGEVQLTSSIPIAPVYSIVSSALPIAGALDTALGFPVANNDFVFQFNNTTGGYITSDFADGDWEGDLGPGVHPFIAVGEAFFVKTTVAHASWNRTFTVGP